MPLMSRTVGVDGADDSAPVSVPVADAAAEEVAPSPPPPTAAALW